jgi:selenocysteine lyase/cysteine desulfurase
VQWSNGYRADLAAFGDLARRHGVLLVVDAIQQLGAVGLDVGRTPVDFLVSGGHKWLNAPAGRGFLYVHPRLVERLRPPHGGYLGVAEPPEGWAEYFATPSTPAVREYDFVADARRFETGGTGNYPGNVVLGASVALINELGIAAVEGHVLSLAGRLREELRRAGAAVVSPGGPSPNIFSTLSSSQPRRKVLWILTLRRVPLGSSETALGRVRPRGHPRGRSRAPDAS